MDRVNHMLKNTLIFFIFIIFFSNQCIAVDKSIYYGKWEGKSFNDFLYLNISKNTITIKTGGKKITKDIKHGYVYSNNSPYPFLSILFTDKKETEHLLYFVIGEDSKDRKEKLSGFYERSTIIPDTDGELKSSSEKIELIKISTSTFQ